MDFQWYLQFCIKGKRLITVQKLNSACSDVSERQIYWCLQSCESSFSCVTSIFHFQIILMRTFYFISTVYISLHDGQKNQTFHCVLSFYVNSAVINSLTNNTLIFQFLQYQHRQLYEKTKNMNTFSIDISKLKNRTNE